MTIHVVLTEINEPVAGDSAAFCAWAYRISAVRE